MTNTTRVGVKHVRFKNVTYKVPNWAQFMAVDKNGQLWAFQQRPVWCNLSGQWQNERYTDDSANERKSVLIAEGVRFNTITRLENLIECANSLDTGPQQIACAAGTVKLADVPLRARQAAPATSSSRPGDFVRAFALNIHAVEPRALRYRAIKALEALADGMDGKTAATQIKPVAALYGLQQDGVVIHYTTSAEEAARWKTARNRNDVIEFVTLQTVQEMFA